MKRTGQTSRETFKTEVGDIVINYLKVTGVNEKRFTGTILKGEKNLGSVGLNDGRGTISFVITDASALTKEEKCALIDAIAADMKEEV